MAKKTKPKKTKKSKAQADWTNVAPLRNDDIPARGGKRAVKKGEE